MNKIITCASLAMTSIASTAVAADALLFDFGQTPATSPYLTLSPGHTFSGITGTTWNTISTSDTRSDFFYDSGDVALDLTLDLGQEDAGGGTNIINFDNAIVNTNLVGTGGGTTGQQSLVGDPGSIYGSGNIAGNTAPARDGFFGNGTATTTGVAIGMRLDGLAAGEYLIYVMARNTNGNAPTAALMNVFADTALPSTTFDFSGLTPFLQANTNFNNSNASIYNSFSAGENFLAIPVTVENGESIYLAVDGTNTATERRGFLQMVQIVPEPTGLSLLCVGFAATLGLRRRRH